MDQQGQHYPHRNGQQKKIVLLTAVRSIESPLGGYLSMVCGSHSREPLQGEDLRIHLPRTSVNKDKKKGAALLHPGPRRLPSWLSSGPPRASTIAEEKSVWWCTIFHPSSSRR